MEKYRKALLGITIVIAVLFLFIYAIRTSQKGIELEGSFLKLSTKGELYKYTGTCYGEPTEVTVKGDYRKDPNVDISVSMGNKYRRSYQVKVDKLDENGAYSVEFIVDGNTIFVGTYRKGDMLYDSNGQPYFGENIVTTVTSYQGVEWGTVNVNYSQLIGIVTEDSLMHNGQWIVYWAITLIGVSSYVIDIIFPEFFFKLRYSLTVENPEPSELYLFIQHLSWYIGPVAFGLFYLYGLFK